MIRRAIYPGSFDPPTLGHLDIIERSARMFDTLIVAVGRNSEKRSLLSVEERLEALRRCTKHIKNIEVSSFDGLLVNFAHESKAGVIVRGLRAISDFDYEFQIATANSRLMSSLDTVFLMTKWEFSFISSSVVREIASLNGDFGQFVPPEVTEIVLAKLNGKNYQG